GTYGSLAAPTGGMIIEGNVGIGTTGPGALLDVEINTATDVFEFRRTGFKYFTLDYGGSTANFETDAITYWQSLTGQFLLTDTRTDATAKAGRLGVPHYTNTEEPFLLYLGISQAGSNVLSIGGGSALGNVATQIGFFTAANNTTTTGTEVVRIDNAGNVGIGTTAPGAKLHLYNSSPDTAGNASLILEDLYSTHAPTIQIKGHGSSLIAELGDSGTSTGVDKGFLSLYSETVQTVRLDVNGNSYFNGGNVGIGTTGPGTLLTLGSAAPAISVDTLDTADTKYLSLSGGGGAGSSSRGAGIYLYGNENATNAYKGDLHLLAGLGDGASNMGQMEFYLGSDQSSPKVLIDNAGNVGIGTTGPLARLGVIGTDSLNTSFAGNISGATGTGLVITNAGNVGIGTTGPGAKLHVVGSAVTGAVYSGNAAMIIEKDGHTDLQFASGTSYDQGIYFGDTGSAGMGRIIYSHGNDSMRIYANNAERVRITSTGNVGIGTTVPGAKLEIAGVANQLRLSDAGNPSANYYDIVRNASTGYLDFQGSQATYNGFLFKNNSAATILYLDPTQKVGIGKTPSVALDVNGSASVSGNTILSGNITGGASGALYYDSANAQLRNGNSPTGLFFGGQGEFQARRESANATIRIVSVGATSQSYLAFDRARGTIASPTGILSGDVVGSIVGVGYDGVSATMTHGPQITLSTTENWDATHNGNRIDFYTIANGTTNQVNTLALNQGNVSMAGNLTVSGSGNTTISGNVGIGTTGPGYKLEVFSTAANPAAIITSSITNSSLLIGNTSTGIAALNLDASNGDAVGSDYLTIRQNNDLTADIFTQASAGILSLGSKGTTGTLNIDGGNVGIGTTGPLAKFDVDAGTASYPNPFNLYGATSGNGNVFGKISNINTDGGVLFALGETNGDTATPFYIVRYGSTHASKARDVEILNAVAGNLALGTSGAVNMFIQNGGNVGIGTTAPNSRLTANTQSPSANALLFN
ncbi:hypothetical protein COY32_06760, partial [candidate division WWE3 bacterium CG_4_10_14_0_2_um_filter_41_14]